MLPVFNQCLQNGQLLPHHRRSATVLLYKKGRKTDPANYRPIALINSDAKIFTKLIANRIKPVMSLLIHPDQSGFVPGRNIYEALTVINDIWHRRHLSPIVLLFLDFEKAYDRVNWEYLWKVLTRLGFGPNLIHMIKTTYTARSVNLVINNKLSTPIEVTRGVLQGDPLSAALFVLSILPLANLLRNHPERGVPNTNNIPSTSSLFCDDTTILSTSVGLALAQLYMTLQIFCPGSGAKININKTVLLTNIRHVIVPPPTHPEDLS